MALIAPSSDIRQETSAVPPGVATITDVGFSTNWECITEDDETSYINSFATSPGPGNISGANIVICGLQAVTDPLIDVGWTIRILARQNSAAGGSPISVQIALISSDEVFFFHVQDITADILGDNFVLVTIPLDATVIQAIRAESLFGNLAIYLMNNFNIIGAGSAYCDYAFYQLEVPSAGPVIEPIEIESDAGLVFSGSYNAHEYISSAGLVFDDSGSLIFFEFVSEFGIVFSGGELGGGFAYTSDAGLIFNTEPKDIVISVDSSGMYGFILGQHFDEILSRNTYASETIQVAIPEPFGKTGYYGG